MSDAHEAAARSVRALFPGAAGAPVPNWIAGRWSAEGSGTFATIDPTTRRVFAEVVIAGDEQIQRAVEACASASVAWWKTDGQDRARVLRRVADAIRAHGDELGLVDTIDAGRPIRDTRTRDIERAARLFEYWAGVTDRIRGANIPVQPGFANVTVYEPYGVVAAVTPWNYPLTNAATKLAPALATGNAVVLKPAEQSPLSALLLAATAHEAGLPAGLLSVLNGPGQPTGQALVAHPGISKVMFTGSTAVGKSIARVAGENLTSVSLELGGKSPNLVFADADLDRAAAAAAFSSFMNQGQTCTAGTRLLVQRPIVENFLEAVRHRVAKMIVGDPLDPATHVGPLISADQFEAVRGYIELGERQGARRLDLAPASVPTDDGFFLLPTIFVDVPADARIAREEIFGPVLSVFSFDDDDEAVEIANDTAYGLSASVWTSDISRAHRLSQRLQAGLVWINAIHALHAGSPYGGYRQSGLGLEMGLEAVAQLMRVKSIWTAVEPWRSPWD